MADASAPPLLVKTRSITAFETASVRSGSSETASAGAASPAGAAAASAGCSEGAAGAETCAGAAFVSESRYSGCASTYSLRALRYSACCRLE